MPAFWPNYPKSDFPQLGNSAEAQIRAIRDHLLTLRGGPSPMPRMAMARESFGGLEAGETTVTTSVTVVWELAY